MLGDGRVRAWYDFEGIKKVEDILYGHTDSILVHKADKVSFSQ